MLGSRLGRWWKRLTGRGSGAPPAVTPRVVAGGKSPPPAAEPDDLQVVDDLPRPPGSGQGRGPGAAGFDPYSSDAGYQKPHGWERVDHD